MSEHDEYYPWFLKKPFPKIYFIDADKDKKEKEKKTQEEKEKAQKEKADNLKI